MLYYLIKHLDFDEQMQQQSSRAHCNRVSKTLFRRWIPAFRQLLGIVLHWKHSDLNGPRNGPAPVSSALCCTKQTCDQQNSANFYLESSRVSVLYSPLSAYADYRAPLVKHDGKHNTIAAKVLSHF